MSNNITISKGYRTITINDTEISVNAPGNICPVMKLSHNNDFVLKVNKTTVSTCNAEFLAYYLETSRNAFNAVYSYIKTRDYNAIDEINNARSMTKAAFYNHFNRNEKTLNKFIEFFKSCSSSTKQQIIYDHICFNHDAKMAGVISMSTNVSLNRYCQARCKNRCAICSHCYAASLTNMRQGLKNKTIRLHRIITEIELSKEDIPVINADVYKYFRFEAFGDLNNAIQVKNYNLIATVNSDINFTLWTKNPSIIQQAINDNMTLSNNLVVGLSSLYLNKPDLKTAHKYDFIRFLFTVYDDQFIEENNVIINCGAKHCISCGICYKYLHEFKHGLQLINERLK